MTTSDIIIYIGIPLVGVIFSLFLAQWLYFTKLVSRVERDSDSHQKELYEFRLYCANQYATLAFAKDVEMRIGESLRRIEVKVDKLADRIDERRD